MASAVIATVAPGDEAGIRAALGLVRDVFWDFVATDYEPEGVAEFEDYIAYENIAGQMAEAQLALWSCVYQGRVIGVLAAKPPCHISLLFVDRKFQRRGIARAMFQKALPWFETLDAGEITVHASPVAVPVYQRLGFAATGPETTENGMTYLPMRRPLATKRRTGGKLGPLWQMFG